MKRFIITILPALLLCACAKTATTATNETAVEYFNAWMKIYHPELLGKSVPPGYYIMKDIPGSGDEVLSSQECPYLYVNCTAYDLSGNILSTTDEKISRQLGTYAISDYYGPKVFARLNSTMSAGLDAAVTDMKVGGSRKIIIPGWLMTSSIYSTEAEYVANVTGKDTIYDIEIVERIPDIEQWEIDSLKRHMQHKYGFTAEQCEKDTLKAGYYKIQHKASSTGEAFSKDTTVYINYTGRLLNGKIFDTTVERTAKDEGIFNSGKTYGPVSFTLNKTDYTQSKMGSNSVIDGFAYLLNTMGPYEAASGIFCSQYGYSSSGSGSSIPAYSPLTFEIQIVDKP